MMKISEYEVLKASYRRTHELEDRLREARDGHEAKALPLHDHLWRSTTVHKGDDPVPLEQVPLDIYAGWIVAVKSGRAPLERCPGGGLRLQATIDSYHFAAPLEEG